MDFIINNYLWFIIGGILIIMIVIGYFAEKTDFGRKPLREKNKTDEINTAEGLMPEPQTENKGINDVLTDMAEFTPLTTDKVNEENIIGPQAENATENNVQTNQEMTATNPLPEVDLNTIGVSEQEMATEDIVNIESISNLESPTEDLTAPFGDNVSEEAVKVDLQPEPISEVVEAEQGTEDDEVWRF